MTIRTDTGDGSCGSCPGPRGRLASRTVAAPKAPDFHALFNSLCRAKGIASGFESGLYLLYERGAEDGLGGYHCCVLFRVPGKTWVSVDISEGDKLPYRRGYFLGGDISNRVTLSTGRDIALEPAQTGEPLKYFVDPYAEADGVPVETHKEWTFEDLD